MPGREQCYKIEILPHRGQFYIEIHDNIGIMNNVSHEMPLPGSCLQVRASLMDFFLSLTIQIELCRRGYILRILSETVYNILYNIYRKVKASISNKNYKTVSGSH